LRGGVERFAIKVVAVGDCSQRLRDPSLGVKDLNQVLLHCAVDVLRRAEQSRDFGRFGRTRLPQPLRRRYQHGRLHVDDGNAQQRPDAYTE
jgi:hypothetical protein